MSFMESAISTNWYFLAFFSGLWIIRAWPVNYESYFGRFEVMWTVLKYYRIFGTILYRKINFNRQPLFSCFLSQFGTVCYVCQVCKLKLLFWTIFILIGSYFYLLLNTFYHSYTTIVFRIVLFDTFWGLWKFLVLSRNQ